MRSQSPSKSSPMPQRRYRLLLAFVVLLAASDFLLRGPLRGDGSRDLVSPYVSSYSLLHGKNPYAVADFGRTFFAAGGTPELFPNFSGMHSIYPPFSIAVFSPFALLSMTYAIVVYKALCTLLYIGLILLLARRVGEGWRSPARLAFVAFSLGLSAIQTGIHVANLSILSFVVCGFALLLALNGKEVLAGILLALGACLKPTDAMAFVILFLLYKRRASISLIVTSVVALAVSFSFMRGIAPAWKLDYAASLRFMFSPAGAASFTNPGPGHYDLLNLQVPLFEILRNPLAANVLAWVIGLALTAWWLYVFAPLSSGRRPPRSERSLSWLAVSSLTLIALLPTYQRNYNLAVVVFTLLWAFANLRLPIAKAILLLSTLFLTPGEALLKTRVHSPVLIDGFFWRAFVLPHATWILLAITCLLLTQAQRDRAVQPREPRETLPQPAQSFNDPILDA
jgi:hypothetical protein